MPTRQERRSEETKRAISLAAGQLFAERGFDTVTMREIAKTAGCSHTTIYLYFKDKEALLHHLSMVPLQALQSELQTLLETDTLSPDERLRAVSRSFLTFCFAHRNMYNLLFLARGSRVDEEAPALEVQKARNQMFGQLMRAMREYLQLDPTDERVLAYARVYFFTLHGMIGTYTTSEESNEALMARLSTTFDLAVEVLMEGSKQTVKKGANLK